MDKPTRAEGYAARLARHIPALTIIAELWLSICIAALLVVAGLVAVGTTVWGLLQEGLDARVVVSVVDQLLLVLILVEILHTVRHSIEAHELKAEPFLVVGLIAIVRRILKVTLMASEAGGTEEAARSFNHNMIELGVLAGLTVVLIGSIFMARRTQA